MTIAETARAYSALAEELDQLKRIRGIVQLNHSPTKNVQIPYSSATRQLIARLNKVIYTTERDLQKVDAVLDIVPDEITREVLYRNLIHGENLQDVADNMYISISTAVRHKQKGIQFLESKQ